MLARRQARKWFNRRCTRMHADAPGGAISRKHTLPFEIWRDRRSGIVHRRASAFIGVHRRWKFFAYFGRDGVGGAKLGPPRLNSTPRPASNFTIRAINFAGATATALVWCFGTKEVRTNAEQHGRRMCLWPNPLSAATAADVCPLLPLPRLSAADRLRVRVERPDRNRPGGNLARPDRAVRDAHRKRTPARCRALLRLRHGGLEPLRRPEGADIRAPDVHIYTRSKLPWIVLPEGVPAFEAYYDSKTLWPAESLARRRAILG